MYLKQNCRQLEVKYIPYLLSHSQELYNPTYIPLYAEFYFNPFGTSFMHTKFQDFVLYILQHNSAIRIIEISSIIDSTPGYVE
jgi:hypothetical protein